jgi:hypothetical protein
VGGSVVGLSTLALWFWSGDRVLAPRFAAAATGAAFGTFLVVARNRRKRRLEHDREKQNRIEEKRRRVENKRRLAEERGTLVASIHDMMPQLDHHLTTAVISSEDSQRGRIVRTPMRPGRGSHLLNRVRFDHPDVTADLVEKAATNDSNELSFWQEMDPAHDLVLQTELYDSIEPFGIVQGTTSSVLYFPYLPKLHRGHKTLRGEFRSNRDTIVSAVAAFNGRNIVTSRPMGTQSSRAFVASRPTRFRLERNLDVSAVSAKRLQRSWDAVYERWPLVEAAHERIPRGLSHNDVPPGNALKIDGVTTFVDFGLAGFAPWKRPAFHHSLVSGDREGPRSRRGVVPHLPRWCAAVRPHSGARRSSLGGVVDLLPAVHEPEVP